MLLGAQKQFKRQKKQRNQSLKNLYKSYGEKKKVVISNPRKSVK